MHKAVFLDRDGTINEDVGYFCSADKLIFIPRAIKALGILQERFQLFIITNQSGIGKNIFSEEDFIQFNSCFNSILKNNGINIRHVYYCPHTKEDNCICHKPSTYFLKRAKAEYNIDFVNSYIVGDHPHDIEMAKKVGAKSVYLLTGHGEKHRNELLIKPEFIATDLYKATIWIMENDAKNY